MKRPSLIVLLGLFCLSLSIVRADEPNPALQPITAENKDQIILLDKLGNDRVYDLAWSGDGRWLAVGSSPYAELYATDDFSAFPRKLPHHGHNSLVWNVAFSADSQLLMTSTGSQHFWDVESGQLQGVYESGGRAAVHPSERGLFVSRQHETIEVIDITETPAVLALSDNALNMDFESLLSIWSGAHNHVSSFVFSPDGHLLAQTESLFLHPGDSVSPWQLSGEVILWQFSPVMAAISSSEEQPPDDNLAHLGLGLVLEGNPGGVQQTAFHPTADVLVGAYSDGSLIWWDTQSGATLCNFSAHFGAVWDVAFSSDGESLLSVGWDGVLRWWDTTTCGVEQQSPIYFNSGLTALALSPDAKQLAVGAWDGRAWVLDLVTGQQQLIRNGHLWSLWDISFSPDGDLIAAGDDNNAVWLWDVATRRVKHGLYGHQGPVIEVAFSPDGALLASGSMDRTIRLWDVASGENLNLLEGHTDSITNLAFSPDGAWLASASRDGTLRLWDVAEGLLIKVHENQNLRPLYHFAFSPDGQWLAYGDLWLWRLDRNIVTYFDVYDCVDPDLACSRSKSAIRQLSFSADSRLLHIHRAVSNAAWLLADDGLQAYEGEFEPALAAFTPPLVEYDVRINSDINVSAFNPDFTLMAVGRNGAIELWGLPEN